MEASYFIPKDEPLFMLTGCHKAFDGGVWALYHCPLTQSSALVWEVPGGWRIMPLAGLINIKDLLKAVIIAACFGCLQHIDTMSIGNPLERGY